MGVCQLVNRTDDGVFTHADRVLFEAFALFCGLGIHNTQMYENAVRAMAKQQVAIEVLSYHAVSPVEDAIRLKKLLIPSVRFYKLNEFSFTDFECVGNFLPSVDLTIIFYYCIKAESSMRLVYIFWQK